MTGVSKTLVMAAAILMFLVAGARPASAQIVGPWSENGFITVNGGLQPHSRTAETSGTTPVFGESATWESEVGVGSGGIFDINGGVRVWGNVAAAVGWSSFSDGNSTTVNASIPDPLFFDMPRAASVDVGGLKHTETALHVSAAYVMPLTDKLEATVFVGPSFFFLKKDLVDAINVSGETLTGATTTQLDESAVGGHFTVDVRYRLLEDLGPARSVGVGIFLRYAGASIDVPQVSDSIKVGGFHYGAGVRIGF
jgi:hypothetical protein